MKPWPNVVGICFWLAAAVPAAASDQSPTGDTAWCEAHWPAIARAEAIAGKARSQPKGLPAYCQARPTASGRSGASADKALRAFMARCSSACPVSAGPTATAALPAASYLSPAYLTPALLAAGGAVVAASLTGRRDQPASP